MKKVVLILMLMLSIIALGETKEEPIEPNFKPYIFNLKQLRITWLEGSIKRENKVEIRIYDNMNLEENENFKREEFVYDSWKIYYDITYNFNYGEEYFIKIIINNKKTYLLKTNAYSGKPLSENIFLFQSYDNRAYDKAISKTGLFIATAAYGKLRIRNMKGNLLSEFSGFSNYEYKIDIEFNPNKENELFIIDNEYKKITVVNTMTQNVIEEYDNRGVDINNILFSDNTEYFVTIERKDYGKVFSLWKRGNKNAKFTKTGNNFTIIKCFKDYILYLEGDNIMKCDFEGNSTKLFSVEKYKPKYYSSGNGISDGVYNENKRTVLLSFGEKIYELDLKGKLLNCFTLVKEGIAGYYNEQFIENGDKFIICENRKMYIFDTDKFNLVNILDDKYWNDGMEVSENGIVLSGNGHYHDVKLSVFY